MELPPPTYALLLGPTLLLLPFVARRARDAREAAFARSTLLALALLEAALILLFYSQVVCWILAAVSAAWLAFLGSPRRTLAAPAAMAPPAIGAGLLFQFLPGDHGFLVYFALALPLLFGIPAAAIAARWLRWDASPRTLSASVALVAFAGFIPASSFFLDFLRSFELAQLPVLLGGAAGLAWLVGRGGHEAAIRRVDAASAMDAGEYAARPPPPTARLIVPLLAASALVSLSVFSLLAGSGLRGFEWAYVGIPFAAAALLPAVPALRRPILLVGASAAALAASLLVVVPAAGATYIVGQDVPLAPVLVASALTATASLLALGCAMASHADARRREDVLHDEGPIRSGFLQRAAASVDVADLVAVAAEMARHDVHGAVVTVHAPRDDPLWTLGDDVYVWLDAQKGPRRVHVALREGHATYHVPPILPEERDA
ncbi:MAG: hypothetical protein HYT80_07655 [Euryarchaeota archaeon]|nr:hypothetical protein [Euryarchaeota archaeon]